MEANRITIYQLDNPYDYPEVASEIRKLSQLTKITVKQEAIPAVVGQLAGIATEILLSDTVQAFTTAVEIGGILWAIIHGVRRLGKSLRIDKGLVKPLLLSKLKDEVKMDSQTIDLRLSDSFVWGPMEIDSYSGLASKLEKGWDGASSPIGYFMAVVVPRNDGLIRTYWYLLGCSGEVSASWTTQTYASRVPEFLRQKGHMN